MRPGRVPRDLASTTISEAEFARILPFCTSKRSRAKFSRNTSLAPSAKRMARTRRYGSSNGWPVCSAVLPTSWIAVSTIAPMPSVAKTLAAMASLTMSK